MIHLGMALYVDDDTHVWCTETGTRVKRRRQNYVCVGDIQDLDAACPNHSRGHGNSYTQIAPVEWTNADEVGAVTLHSTTFQSSAFPSITS